MKKALKNIRNEVITIRVQLNIENNKEKYCSIWGKLDINTWELL